MAIKNEKFDSFLKRTLEQKVYQQVKISEACVIATKDKNYSFRFAFLTDDAFYATDNPPKTILFCIKFSSIFGIELIHDKALFLQKDLQDSVQHVLVKTIQDVNYLKDGSHTHEINPNFASKPNFYRSKWQSFASSLRISQFKDKMGFNTKANVAASRFVKINNSPAQAETVHYQSNPYNTPNNTIHFKDHNLFGTGNTSIERGYDSSSPEKSTLSKPFPNEIPTAEDNENINKTHIYILNGDSVFYVLFIAVQKAFLLNSTVQLSDSNNAGISAKRRQEYNETFLNKLKTSIVTNCKQSSSLEYIYRQYLELCSIIQNHLNAKIYFWKDDVMILASKELLVKFSISETNTLSRRSDEIECMVLVCNSLAQMLKQVEMLDICHVLLQKVGTNFYWSLLDALLRQPTVPALLLLDDELKSILQEYMLASCDLLYELLQAADRVSWKNRKQPQVLTSAFLHSFLESSRYTLNFTKNIVSYVVQVWTRKEKPRDSASFSPTVKPTPLSSSEVVKFYQGFFILHRCLVKCKTTGILMKESFCEEFKYYLRLEGLELKIPELYPAANITRNIISTVANLVLYSN